MKARSTPAGLALFALLSTLTARGETPADPARAPAPSMAEADRVRLAESFRLAEAIGG